MKNLKITLLSILSLLVLGCEKEEISINENPDFQRKAVYLHSEFGMPVPTTKINSQNISYNLYSSEQDLQSHCSEFKNYGEYSSIGAMHARLNGGNFFGGYFVNLAEGTGISIQVFSTEGLLYEEIIDSDEEFYWGISGGSLVEIRIVDEGYSGMAARQVVIGKECNFVPDSDGDGVPDDEDQMPYSNMEETVIIQECNSQVQNLALGKGLMLSDKIDMLEAGTYKNHGQFVKSVAHYLKNLVDAKFITVEEKGNLMKCAGSSSI